MECVAFTNRTFAKQFENLNLDPKCKINPWDNSPHPLLGLSFQTPQKSPEIVFKSIFAESFQE